MKLSNVAVLIIVVVFGLGYQISGSESICFKEGRGDLVQHHARKFVFLDSFAEYAIKSQVILGLGSHLSLSSTPKKNLCPNKLLDSLWVVNTATFFGPFQKLKIGHTFIYVHKFNQRLHLFPFHYFW